MARGGGSIIFTARAGSDTRRVSKKYRRVADDLNEMILREFETDLSFDVEQAFIDHAPIDEGDLIAELSAEVSIGSGGRPEIAVSSPVTDEDTGYPYTDVTRIGHKGIIEPKTEERLRFFRYGRWITTYSTAGHHPDHDWAEDAAEDAERETARASERIGRVIETRLRAAG